MPLADYDKIKGNPNLTPVGHITAPGSPCRLVLRDGSEIDLKAQGWNSFQKRTQE